MFAILFFIISTFGEYETRYQYVAHDFGMLLLSGFLISIMVYPMMIIFGYLKK